MKTILMTHTGNAIRSINPRCFAICVSLFLLMGLSACEDTPPHLKAGDPLLPFTLQSLNADQVSVPIDTHGKVVALRFWADWCPFCLKEMQDIEPVYQAYKDDGLVVLAVNVGQSRERAAKFVDKLGISYTTLLDEESDVARQYRVIGLPMTFFIDRNGVVQSKILGESAPGVFTEQVKKLIARPDKGIQ